MKKWLITAMIVGLFFGQAYFFGIHDYIALVWTCGIAIFLFHSLFRLYLGNRKTLRVNSKPDSWLHHFLSDERPVFLTLTTVIMALIFSVVVAMLVKGLLLQHGGIPFFTVITVSSLALYSFINTKHEVKTVEDNINQDITKHTNELVTLIYAAVVLNIILSLAFSAYDTYKFMDSDITISNFTEKTVDESIESGENNSYGRMMINAYLLLDNLKIALATQFITQFEQQGNFYLFYPAILVLNLFKFMFFAFSFVLFQKGLDRVATYLSPLIKKGLDRVATYLSPLIKKGLNGATNYLLLLVNRTKETYRNYREQKKQESRQ